jgi:hypothetical protein
MSVIMSSVGVKVQLWRIPLFMYSAKLKVVMANSSIKLKKKTDRYCQAIDKLGTKNKEDTVMACGKGKKKGGKKGGKK